MPYDIKSRAGLAPLAVILIVAGVAVVVGGGLYTWGRYLRVQPVPSIEITSPAGTDTWTVGSTHTIAWTAKNVPPGNKISIAIRRIPPPPLPAEGQEFDPLIFTNLENTGSADWTISDMYPTGTYILEVNSYASVPVTNPITAESAPFAITRGQIIGGQKDAHGCLPAAGYSWCGAKQACVRPWEEYCTAATPKTAMFTCADSKTISATFYPTDDKYVDLVLSDGRKLSVPRAISASGARYATADESFVFWNKGDTAFITENGTTTFSNCAAAAQSGTQFTNPSGGYGFDYPPVWKAAINRYNNSNSLFGPDANSASGLGGVEVFPGQTSIDKFLGGVAAQYDSKINIAVDGVTAVRVHYKSSAISGTEVVLLKDGKIFNIYINSEKSEDISLFDQLVSTFKFVR